MRKSELLHWLSRVDGDPEILIEDPRADGVAREASVVDEVWAVSDAAFSDSQRLFWERNDPQKPAKHPGDSPDDPEPVIALVLR